MEWRLNMYKEKIVNLETGEETWRDYTEAEIAEVEAAQAESAQRKAEAEAKAEAKAAAEAKLVALGLDLDDLRTLGL
jgi:hypothetical protein